MGVYDVRPSRTFGKVAAIAIGLQKGWFAPCCVLLFGDDESRTMRNHAAIGEPIHGAQRFSARHVGPYFQVGMDYAGLCQQCHFRLAMLASQFLRHGLQHAVARTR